MRLNSKVDKALRIFNKAVNLSVAVGIGGLGFMYSAYMGGCFGVSVLGGIIMFVVAMMFFKIFKI